MRRESFVLLFLFALSLTTFAADDALIASTIEKSAAPEQCKKFIASIKDTYTFDWFDTFEIPNNTDSTPVRIFYYFKKTAKLANPVAFFNGGPGLSSQYQQKYFDDAVKTFGIKSEINFIYIDQRGTGCSTAKYPIGLSNETVQRSIWYGSRGIVFDAEGIRNKLLGAKGKWKIFGQSYGAYIVYRYLTLFPQSVSKAYAHGNAIGVSNYDRTFNRIVSQFRVLEAYLKEQPEDRLRVHILNLYFSDSQKCFKRNNITSCGYENFGLLMNDLGFRQNWKDIAVALRKMVPENTINESAVTEFVAQKSTPASIYHNLQDPEKMADKMNFTFNIMGVYDWDTTPLNAVVCRNIFEQMKVQYKINDDQIFINECKAPIQFDYTDKLAKAIQPYITPISPDFIQPENLLSALTSYKVPLYVYSGELDCYVPKESFTKQIKALGSKLTYRHFKTSGHEGYYTEPKVFEDLLR